VVAAGCGCGGIPALLDRAQVREKPVRGPGMRHCRQLAPGETGSRLESLSMKRVARWGPVGSPSARVVLMPGQAPGRDDDDGLGASGDRSGAALTARATSQPWRSV
jgi:hypothetical protein